MYDEDLTITLFDPNRGILFKFGRIYKDRNRQIASFEEAIGFQLPADFVEMVGEYFQGGFDGHYRVHLDKEMEIQWHSLMLMKLADEYDIPGHDTISLLRAKPGLFGDEGGRKLIPFGDAYIFRSPNDMVKGYLAFDVGRKSAIVFAPEAGGAPIQIADSFRLMMLGSSFVFYG